LASTESTVSPLVLSVSHMALPGFLDIELDLSIVSAFAVVVMGYQV